MELMELLNDHTKYPHWNTYTFSVCILAAYLLYKLKNVVNYFTESKPQISATESTTVNMSDSSDITVGE